MFGAQRHSNGMRAALIVDAGAYRDAMARLGAAVSVITSDGPAGRCGFTASAVCSVTADPPTLLVCMNRNSRWNEDFKRNGVLCVNVLAATQEHFSARFAEMLDMETRFAAGHWITLETGSPVLQDAVVSFDCRIVQVAEVGTHSVLFGEVAAIQSNPVSQGLIYFGRAYHRIGLP